MNLLWSSRARIGGRDSYDAGIRCRPLDAIFLIVAGAGAAWAEADMDPNHRPMPRTPEANQPGIHRFSRGLNYFRIASEQTVRLRVPFGWKIATAPGVAHSNTLMAPHAAARFFGR